MRVLKTDCKELRIPRRHKDVVLNFMAKQTTELASNKYWLLVSPSGYLRQSQMKDFVSVFIRLVPILGLLMTNFHVLLGEYVGIVSDDDDDDDYYYY